jgi:hypothetical protein
MEQQFSVSTSVDKRTATEDNLPVHQYHADNIVLPETVKLCQITYTQQSLERKAWFVQSLALQILSRRAQAYLQAVYCSGGSYRPNFVPLRKD